MKSYRGLLLLIVIVIVIVAAVAVAVVQKETSCNKQVTTKNHDKCILHNLIEPKISTPFPLVLPTRLHIGSLSLTRASSSNELSSIPFYTAAFGSVFFAHHLL